MKQPELLCRVVFVWAFAVGTGVWPFDAPYASNGYQTAIAQEANLFTELFEQGLPFTDQQRFKVPPATWPMDGSPAAQRAALEHLAGKIEWERFARNAITAPVAVDIETLDDPAGERLGLRVHNAFVVYTSLATLRDRELMEEIFGPAPVNSDKKVDEDAVRVVMKELPPAELTRLGFDEQANCPATFAYIELPLLNKVLLHGVIRIEKRESSGAVEFAWALDSSFNSSEEFASRWTRLERDVVGKLVEGKSFPYSGCGGWMGVYEVDPASKQLLVESQMLLHEPTEWFAGSNFLRSKLPMSLQENARTFRRKIAPSK